MGTLYIVATPLGNLRDITYRAVEVLKTVDYIAAEDTRHSSTLLQNFAINTPVIALHEHNEAEKAAVILQDLRAGKSIALISDAGTPLISDPGYVLVQRVREAGIDVTPVPGASAVIAALSVSGLPTDRFTFEGFLPSKSSARKTRLERLVMEPRTMVFYEAPHRIIDSLTDLKAIFGDDRRAVIARELTKKFETILSGTLTLLLERVQADKNQQLGEFVVMVSGAPEVPADDIAARRLLTILLEELPVKQAAGLAAKILDRRKNELYQQALELNPSRDR